MQTTKCDNCGKTGDDSDFAIRLIAGWKSKFDPINGGCNKDFCEDSCLKEWAIKNIKDEPSDKQ